jgi:hypothetical protein
MAQALATIHYTELPAGRLSSAMVLAFALTPTLRPSALAAPAQVARAEASAPAASGAPPRVEQVDVAAPVGWAARSWEEQVDAVARAALAAAARVAPPEA